MLYVAVQLQQPVTTSFDVTLIVQLPRGRALVQKPPKVRVQISGKGSQILKLRSLAGDITRRVPDTLTASTYSIQLDPSEVELALPKGADVRVMEVRPSEITLALDSVSRKEVRIVSLVSVTPDSAQVLHGGLSMTPTTARLAARGRAYQWNHRRVCPDHGHRATGHYRPRHSRFGHGEAARARAAPSARPVHPTQSPPPQQWLTPSSASKRRVMKPRPPCWSAASLRVSSFCRRTSTRCSAAS